MANITIRVKGARTVIRGLQNLESNVIEVVSEELEANSAEMAADAQVKAPVNDGNLRAGIGFEGKDLQWSVYSNAQYSAFVEFGTKTRVNVPPALQQLASQFKGMKISSGKFEDNIKQWMKGKGIPEEALYPIIASILKYGIYPQPFFGPAYDNMVRRLPKDLEAALKREVNKSQ